MRAGRRVMCEAQQHDTPERNRNMARISNKDKALAYAAEHGIILTVEDDMSVFDIYTVEVWSLRAHLSETGSDCHTYFARGNTEARAWADALAYMQRLTECHADCSCRDRDQDQDQDRDTDQDQDQDDTLTMANHQDHYQNHSNEAEVWVCGCCARMVNTGDESGCRDFHGHTHPTCDKNIVRADIEHTFEVGYFHANCNGCGEIVRTGGTLYAATRLINN